MTLKLRSLSMYRQNRTWANKGQPHAGVGFNFKLSLPVLAWIQEIEGRDVMGTSWAKVCAD